MPLEDARAAFVVSPFTRLARAHVLSVAGDALFTMGLAGTVFFDATNLDAARGKVFLTLVLTIAPFAVAAPLIGPTLDRMRGGRRWVILASCAGRALLSFLLITNFDNLAFYPLAFCMLVLGKSYQISKSALVPTTVRNDTELVEANSKLSMLSGVAVVAVAVPGGLFWHFGGPQWVVGLAAVVFLVGAVVSIRLPSTAVAISPADDIEEAELRSGALILAATGMGIMRALVGFLSFLLAFNYRDGDAVALGVVAVAAQAGFLLGAALAPRLRVLVAEEYILIGVLLTVAVTSLGAALTGGLFVASMLSLTMGVSSSAGKQAFDAVVQRDAPDANRGRSFARFETVFQLLWVMGALVPVAISIQLPLGFAIMAVLGGFGGVWYWMGLQSANSRAASLVRRLRRQQRAEDALALQRDLGFGEISIDGDPTAELPVRPGRMRSAAARAAERRRTRRSPPAVPGQLSIDFDLDDTAPTDPAMPTEPPRAPPDPPVDPVVGAAAAELGLDPQSIEDSGPNLDWNPKTGQSRRE